MKRSMFFVAALAASALTGAASAYFVTNQKSESEVSAPHATTEFASDSVGSHFTAYDAQNYPDLTYAAENAVKAVVNIEKTEEVQ